MSVAEPPKKRSKSSEKPTKHAASIVRQMERFRASRRLVDIHILVESRRIAAHKLVLACVSPYFEAMFTGTMAESARSEIALEHVAGHAVELLVEHAYTSRIELTHANVEDVFEAAAYLQFDDVVEKCVFYLEENIADSNCFGIHRLASRHNCSHLKKISWLHALNNFEGVVREDEFLCVDIADVIRLIKDDRLNANSEETVFNAALKWVQRDVITRSSALKLLLKAIRLCQLPWSFLVENVLVNKLISTRDDCQEIIQDVKDFRLSRKVVDNNHLRPRNSVSGCDVIYVIGGIIERNPTNTIELFNPITNTWRASIPMETPRRGCTVAVTTNNNIYVIGGSDGNKALNSIEIYDPITDTWEMGPPMKISRSSVACAIIDSFIYVTGGYDGRTQCLATGEKFSAESKQWSDFSAMATARSMHGCVSVNNWIYVIGGYDGIQDLKSCERYSPLTDTWEPIPAMTSRRSLAAICHAENRIIVAGGTEGRRHFSSVEYFDVCLWAWFPLKHLLSPRSRASAVAWDGRVFLFGGAGNCDVEAVDINDADSSWTKVSRMNSPRERFACCAIASA